MLTNNLKKQVDQPCWEWSRFFPAANSALSEMTCVETPDTRYMYMLVASTFWRYDTYNDVWTSLAPPPTAPLLILSLKYLPYGGYIGQVISAGANTLTGAFLQGNKFIGNKIRIYAGTGAGQERTITANADAVIADSGIVTTGAAITLTDNLKKWDINQWSGYTCKIVNGVGITQRRKILYNTATVLTFSDPQWQQLAPQENQALVTATTGASLYTIESNVLTVDRNWTTQPDGTSKYRILSGLIGCLSTMATTPFQTYQVYDIVQDVWITRSCQQGLLLASGLVANDISFHRLEEGELPTVSDSGTAATGSATTLNDTTKSWTVNAFIGLQLSITAGTGAGQISNIISNTATQIVIAAGATIDNTSVYQIGFWYYDVGKATVTGSSVRQLGDTTKTWAVDRWANYELKITAGAGAGSRKRILGNTASILYLDGNITSPDATSVYVIRPFRSMHMVSGWALASMLGYDSDLDLWTQGFKSDGGIANIMSVRSQDSGSIACTATRAVNGIKTIVATPTAGGSGYVVGDVLTANQTGTGGLLLVTSTRDNGVVTGLKLLKCGTNYAVAAGRTTSGGTGTLCTFEITALATIGTITTLIAHNFQKGDSIIFAGADVATAAWNATYTILGVSSVNTIDVETTAAGTAVALTAQANNVIVDASKNWTPNEHAGKIVILSLTGLTGTIQPRRITSNTASALTIYGTALGTNAAEGLSRYIIHDPDAFGKAVQDKNPVRLNTGWCTSSVSATVLTDNTKTWKGNQWLGYKVKVICGTGYNFPSVAITSNTETALTVSGGFGFTPDATSKYIIEDTYGVITTITNTTNAVVTDNTKLWVANQWAGFRLRITAGEGMGQEVTITSNTATALTITGVFATIPVINSSTYTILGVPQRGTGHELSWISNSTCCPGKYILSPRGGITNIWDRYNINTNTWDACFIAGPDTEVFGLGTMYAYDGKDRLYIQKDSTGRIFYIDLLTNTVHGAGTMPYVIGTAGIGVAVNGNRMEIVVTADGLKYLYVMKHTGAALSATGGGTEMFRTLIFT
jgi:hypothetical protein